MKLRIIVISVIATLLLTITVTADPAIWHLSDDDSDIHIFGTVHILPPNLEWRTEDINAAFENSDTVWFESPANDPELQGETLQLIQQYGLNAPGNSLSEKLSEEAKVKLSELAAKSGISASILEPMRPWLASLTVSLAYIQSQGYQPESGVESILWPEAKESIKQMSYFETLEEQIRFLSNLPSDVEVAYLEQTLEELEFDGAADHLDRLVVAWAAGDIVTIDEIMNGDARETSPEVFEVLIVQRNQTWIQKIKDILAGTGVHFIAVGAGHLAGSEGIVELLRAEGFEINGP